MTIIKQAISIILALLLFTSCTPLNNTNHMEASDSQMISADESEIFYEVSSAPDTQEVESSTVPMSSSSSCEDINPSNSGDLSVLDNQAIVTSYRSGVLTDKGNVYSFYTGPEDRRDIRANLILTNVKRFNTAYTSNERPAYQTKDDKFYDGYDNAEYKHNFSKSYTLYGNNIVIDEETNYVYRVDWSKDRVITDDDLHYIMKGKDAIDLTFYVDGKEEFLVVCLTLSNDLYLFNYASRTMNKIDSNVIEFCAGEEGRIGGNGYGIWYITSNHTLHHLSGIEWNSNNLAILNSENLHSYSFNNVKGFWRLSQDDNIFLWEDNVFYKLKNGGLVIPLEMNVPDGGINGVVPVIQVIQSTEDDGPVLNPIEYHVIDSNGKLVQ